MAQTIFKRVETKYLITQAQYVMLMNSISSYICPDKYSEYTISNIYFDTDNYELIRTSLEKPVYKEKLRMRSYGKASASTPCFIELKKKYMGIVYKRRIGVPYETAIDVMLGNAQPDNPGQIMKEIDYFMHMYSVSPKVYISYERMAYVGCDDEELRVTFDKNIRFRRKDLRLDAGTGGTAVMEPGKMLMEIKVPGAFPLWLSRALTDLAIYPCSFSKYGTCYTKYIAKSQDKDLGVAAGA